MMPALHRLLAIQHRVGWFVALALIALVAAAPRASLGAGTTTDKNVAEKLATAKTAADYKARAAYFHAKAAHVGGVDLKRDEAMLKAVSGKPLASWGQHCAALIGSDTKMQQTYEAAATELDEAAKNAPK